MKKKLSPILALLLAIVAAFFGYTGLTDELLRAYLTDNALWPADVSVSPLGSTIGTHVGPGAYAVAYFCKK